MVDGVCLERAGPEEAIVVAGDRKLENEISSDVSCLYFSSSFLQRKNLRKNGYVVRFKKIKNISIYWH